MNLFLMLILLVSCAAYTDPEQEKITYYKCEKNQEIAVKHSDDYETILLKYGEHQIILHYFVLESGVGYRTENYLWLTQGKKGKLMTKKADGKEEIVLSDCIAEKMVLRP